MSFTGFLFSIIVIATLAYALKNILNSRTARIWLISYKEHQQQKEIEIEMQKTRQRSLEEIRNPDRILEIILKIKRGEEVKIPIAAFDYIYRNFKKFSIVDKDGRITIINQEDYFHFKEEALALLDSNQEDTTNAKRILEDLSKKVAENPIEITEHEDGTVVKVNHVSRTAEITKPNGEKFFIDHKTGTMVSQNLIEAPNQNEHKQSPRDHKIEAELKKREEAVKLLQGKIKKLEDKQDEGHSNNYSAEVNKIPLLDDVNVDNQSTDAIEEDESLLLMSAKRSGNGDEVVEREEISVPITASQHRFLRRRFNSTSCDDSNTLSHNIEHLNDTHDSKNTLHAHKVQLNNTLNSNRTLNSGMDSVSDTLTSSNTLNTHKEQLKATVDSKVAQNAHKTNSYKDLKQFLNQVVEYKNVIDFIKLLCCEFNKDDINRIKVALETHKSELLPQSTLSGSLDSVNVTLDTRSTLNAPLDSSKVLLNDKTLLNHLDVTSSGNICALYDERISCILVNIHWLFLKLCTLLDNKSIGLFFNDFYVDASKSFVNNEVLTEILLHVNSKSIFSIGSKIFMQEDLNGKKINFRSVKIKSEHLAYQGQFTLLFTASSYTKTLIQEFKAKMEQEKYVIDETVERGEKITLSALIA